MDLCHENGMRLTMPETELELDFLLKFSGEQDSKLSFCIINLNLLFSLLKNKNLISRGLLDSRVRHAFLYMWKKQQRISLVLLWPANFKL